MRFSPSRMNRLITTLIAGASITMVVGCSSSGSGSNNNKVPDNTVLRSILITAIDGYMTGCTVTDSSTPVITAFEVDATNSPGVYEFAPDTPPFGPITSAGCTDASTGLAVPTLRTPAVPEGQTQVVATPLAALVQASLDNDPTKTLAEASLEITTALGLDTSVDLSTYDPIAEMTAAVADPLLDPSIAAQIQAAATQVMATITAIETAEPGTVDDVLSSIATQAAAVADTTATTGTILELTDPDTLTTIITESTTAGVVDLTATAAIAEAVTVVNTSIETAADAVTSTTTLLEQEAFLVTSAAATIVVAEMEAEIVAAVGGDITTLVEVTETADADVTTAEETAVIIDGLSSNPVDSTEVVQCTDGSIVVTADQCPVVTGGTGS